MVRCISRSPTPNMPRSRESNLHLDDLGSIGVLTSSLSSDLLCRCETHDQSVNTLISLNPSSSRASFQQSSLSRPSSRRRCATYGGVDQVLENLLVNLLEGPASRSLLLHSRNSGRLSHHSTLANEDNVSVRELLLELSCESEWW